MKTQKITNKILDMNKKVSLPVVEKPIVLYQQLKVMPPEKNIYTEPVANTDFFGDIRRGLEKFVSNVKKFVADLRPDTDKKAGNQNVAPEKAASKNTNAIASKEDIELKQTFESCTTYYKEYVKLLGENIELTPKSTQT